MIYYIIGVILAIDKLVLITGFNCEMPIDFVVQAYKQTVLIKACLWPLRVVKIDKHFFVDSKGQVFMNRCERMRVTAEVAKAKSGVIHAFEKTLFKAKAMIPGTALFQFLCGEDFLKGAVFLPQLAM